MSGLLKTCLVLTIVGALNWLLVGLFHWNLVGAIFGGDMSMLSRIIYVIVGLCGIVSLGVLGRDLSGRRYDRDVIRTENEMRDTDIRRVA
jgi:uncharacterized membrane protein YuzA (DUF378 family)